ncbi:MAG: DUF6263 family protein [Perlabentimonas sp.]
MNRIFKNFLLLALISLIPVAGAVASGVNFKLNLKKGEVTKYRATNNQVITQTMGGNKQEVKQNQIYEYELSALGKDDQGNFNTTITFTRVAIDINAQGMNMAFDSDEDESSAANNPQLMGFAALVDKSLNAKFSPSGEVVEVSGVDKMIDDMVAEVAADNEGMKAQMKQTMQQSFNQESLKQMFGGSFIEFPAKSLKKGDTWTENLSIVNQFTLNVVNNYTLKSVSGNKAHLDISSTLSTEPGNKSNMQGMEVTYNLFGTQNGEIIVEVETGKILGSEIEQSISGNFLADMAGQEMDVPMSISSKMKVEIIE